MVRDKISDEIVTQFHLFKAAKEYFSKLDYPHMYKIVHVREVVDEE